MQNMDKFEETIANMFSNPEYSSNYLFYAHMIGQCSVKMRDDLPAPAGVAYKIDHYELYINPVMFNEYSLENRLFILKHEMLHILYDHVNRTEERKFDTWNYATDCAINQEDTLGHVPEKCITPASLSKSLNIDVPLKESSEFYYELIQENSDGSNDIPEMIDDHGVWEESEGDEELKKDITKGIIEKAQIETAKGKGKLPGGLSDLINLHTRKSEVSWQKILRNIVGNKKANKRQTIMRSSRRFPKRPDLKGTLKDRTFNLLVICDVSGSMSEYAFTSTLSEVYHICKLTNSSLDLIQVDAEAYPPEKFSKNTKRIERKGNGGTFLSPALKMAEKHNLDYQAIVVLTDGGVFDIDIAEFEAIKKKVIWLVEAGGYMHPSFNSGRMKGIHLKS